MEPTAKQAEFLQALHAGENIFLTGKAGTGKSFIVREGIEQLKTAGKKIVAVAPTGIAANNIDGQTIHSMFRLNPYGILTYKECQFLNAGGKLLLKQVNTIFVDEISMLRPDVLDAMHYTLKKEWAERHAQIYKRLNVRVIELDEVLRQTNEEFISHLNIIREGGKSTTYFKQFIHQEAKGIVIAPHNTTVQQYNEIGLKAQGGPVFTFEAKIEGMAKPEDFNLEKTINVKNGCKIMYLVNSQNNPLRNGTLGTFVSHADCHYIRVGEIDYALRPVQITKKKYVYNSKKDNLELEELGKITQYPIKLAYAISIHKAQGLTFDEVTIDLTRPVFQKGQIYVALSRVRTPEGLRIIVK